MKGERLPSAHAGVRREPADGNGLMPRTERLAVTAVELKAGPAAPSW